MRPVRAVVPLVLFAFACNCGGPPGPMTTIHLDATPSVVNIASGAYTTLTVTGQSDGAALVDQSTVNLEVASALPADCGGPGGGSGEVGSFSADDPSENSTQLQVSGGKAVTKLYAPQTPATAYVCAKFIDAYSNVATSSAKVTFKTASEPTHVNFSCTAKNIGAFYPGVGSIGVKCTAVAEDDQNAPVVGSQVKFLTEAGTFDPDPNGTAGVYLYDPIGAPQYPTTNSGGTKPQDVAPLTGEPSYSCPSNEDADCNPRDGLVTLVAYVEGNPEAQGGMPTPYVDANDNNKYDPGEVLPPNTTYQDQQDKYVWTQIKVLFSGQVMSQSQQNAAGMEDGTYVLASPAATGDLARGQSRNYVWHILDSNLNVVAANNASDVVTFSLQGNVPSGVTLSGGQQQTNDNMSNSMGIQLDSDFHLMEPVGASDFENQSTYAVTLSNNRTQDDTDPPAPLSIVASVQHSLATDDSGSASDNVTDNIDSSLTSVNVTVK